MTDKSLFGRLKRLFSSNVIIRKTKKGYRTVDTNNSQSGITNLADRYTRFKMSSWANMGSIESAVAYQQLQHNLYREYDAMDQDPIITSALDIIADETSAKNEFGSVIRVHHEDENVKQMLENLFHDVLNIEFNLWPWVRNLIKYGDCYLELEIASGVADDGEESDDMPKGIINVNPLSPYDVIRVETIDENTGRPIIKFVYNAYSNPNISATQLGSEKKEYESFEIAHFRLYSDTNFLPYGKSMIEGSRRVWQQLSLMEDAMLIHRIMRAPEKRVIKVDVGNIPPNEVDQYIQRIINETKKVPFMDERTGDYNLKYNIQNLIEDYYLPVRGGDSGTEIDTLKGLDYDMTEDINYLKGKLMASLKVPKSYLGYEEDINGKATLAAQDSRFAKTIERIQRVIISELSKIAMIHLYSNGIDGEDLVSFDLELTIPSKIYEQEKIELYNAKVGLIQQMKDTKMFSNQYMYETIMEMAKAEQDDIQLQVLEDVKQSYRIQKIETEGIDPAKPSGVEGTTDVEEEIAKIQTELNDEGGRPKDKVRYGKDDHPYGRDPLGKKTLKQKEDSVKYKPRKINFEIYKDMLGNKKTILNEENSKKL